MDMGLRGKTALVCASSKGLGRGCAFSLAREGVNLVITARGKEALEQTAQEIRAATGVAVTTVACDITTEAGRKLALAACPNPDILINNAGGPPPGISATGPRHLDRGAGRQHAHPIELIKATSTA